MKRQTPSGIRTSQRRWVITGIVVAVLALGAIMGWHFYKVKTTNPYYPKAAEVTPTPTATTPPSASPQLSHGTAENPGYTNIPQTNQPQTSASGSITITSPTQGSIVTSGTTVIGQARVSETRLYFRLKGGKSGQLASGVVQITPSSSGFVPYSFQLAFTNQVSDSPDQGVLEVYTIAADGAETNLATVTVNIQG